MVEGDSFLLSVRTVGIMLPLAYNLGSFLRTRGRVSHQQISPIKGQIVIYRPSIGSDTLRDAVRATFVGDWKEPSRESRLSARAAWAD